MMPLDFDELKICQLQAKIFELSLEETNYSSPIFIRRFMLSDFATVFDNKNYLNLSNNLEDTFEYLDEEYGTTNYGNIKYLPDVMYWIGYIYRTICIRFNYSSKEVYKYFPSREIVNYYPSYHTYDIVDAAERMVEEKAIDTEQSMLEKAKKIMRKMFHLEKLEQLIDSEITVHVDKPIGYTQNSIVFTQNHGYVEITNDTGDYVKAYVLGINKSLNRFKGKVIAVIIRRENLEGILVVSNRKYSKNEIEELVKFQEERFKHKIILDK